MRFSAARLAHMTDLAAYIFPIQIQSVPMRVLRRRRLPVKLAQQDMRQGFGDRRRRVFENIGNAHSNRPVIQAHIAVGVGEPFVLDGDFRQRRARPYLAVNTAKHLDSRLEKERA
jgi:hypothetical protein